MELEERLYSSKELAEWFGISAKTFSNNRKRYLEELHLFAVYEDLGGRGNSHKGILIKQVLNPTYIKKKKVSRAYQIVKDNFHKAWHKSGYDTAARVGSQIWKSNEELQELISEETAKRYVLKARTEFYGKVYDKESFGELGICKPAYVVLNAWEEAILLTEEQLKIISDIKKEIYHNDQETFLYEALIHHEITEEEFNKAMNSWNTKEKSKERYCRFVSEVSDKLGLMPDKVTLIIKQLRFE